MRRCVSWKSLSLSLSRQSFLKWNNFGIEGHQESAMSFFVLVLDLHKMKVFERQSRQLRQERQEAELIGSYWFWAAGILCRLQIISQYLSFFFDEMRWGDPKLKNWSDFCTCWRNYCKKTDKITLNWRFLRSCNPWCLLLNASATRKFCI